LNFATISYMMRIPFYCRYRAMFFCKNMYGVGA